MEIHKRLIACFELSCSGVTDIKSEFRTRGCFSPVKTNIPTPNEQNIWIWKFTAILHRWFRTEYIKGCSVTSETRHDLSEGTWKKLQMFWRWRQIYELRYLFRTSGSKPLMPVFWIESLAQPFEKQALPGTRPVVINNNTVCSHPCQSYLEL